MKTSDGATHREFESHTLRHKKTNFCLPDKSSFFHLYNESIYYNVGFIEEAIEHQKKVVFLYHDIDENGERVYRRGGHHYIVEPIALVFNEDNYYLSRCFHHMRTLQLGEHGRKFYINIATKGCKNRRTVL